jgi:SAM-dependent methyltransferase
MIRFGKTEEAYDGFVGLLQRLIEENEFKRILDVGGGAQPMLPLEYVEEKNLTYTVLDVSGEELAQAPREYRKIVADIAGPKGQIEEVYDFVFSRFVAEHVRDAERLHENVWDALRPGGMAVHLFPTVYALPFLVNMLLPERLAIWLLPKARREKGKFAAYYKWCTGPNRRAIERFRNLGYEVVEYAGFFGHGYYDRVPMLRQWHGWLRGALLRRPVSMLTSFAWVILRKPAAEPAMSPR